MDNKWSTEEIEEFEKLCTPIVAWLQTKRDNMETIIITADYCKVVSDEIGIPFKLPDNY